METLLKKHAQKIKFAIVGGANTALDFAILFILTFTGLDKIVANYISTGLSMIFSFFVNKSFTFKNKSDKAKRQFVYFIIITLTGLWGLQPIIILAITTLLASTIENDAVSLFIAKLIATVVTLIWNYLLYSKVVFKRSS